MSNWTQYRKAIVNVLTLILAVLSTVTVNGNAGHYVAIGISIIGAIIHFLVPNSDPSA